ncbi:MAG TPA: hypothetical protein VFJ85_17020 [Acidimicrobiales bacterium]|nr:hypothetical protein [Acidimicrobiales bacterium]
MGDTFRPFDAFLVAVAPLPAWSDAMDPAYDPAVEPAPVDLARPVLSHFAFLGPLGFAVAPPDNWERGAAVAIPFVRDDTVVLVVVAPATVGFLVVVTPGVVGDVTAVGVLQSLAAAEGRAQRATFGSFPVPACTPQGFDGLVARHAAAFADAAATLLAERPADLRHIAARTAAAVDEVSRAVQVAHTRRRGEAAWAEGRDGATVQAYERLSELDTLDEDEARRLATARDREAQTAAALERGDDDEREWLDRRADHVRLTHRAVHEAFDRRSSAGAFAAWEDAATAAHEAFEIMYPRRFWDDVERLRAGDPDAVEPLLAFLEADPWCFRSGYAKETILRFLRRHRLDGGQQARVEGVLLHAVDAGDRREFRMSCKLARANATPGLRAGLHARLRSADPGVARRALLMLTSIKRPRLDAAEVAIARGVVLRGAERRRAPRWVGELAWRFWSDDWEDELRSAAISGAPGSDAALRVLAALPRTHLDPESSDRLAALVLRVVDHGGNESWFERMAPRVDSPALRAALERRQEHPDDNVRRRARWALNAMVRAEARRTDP